MDVICELLESVKKTQLLIEKKMQDGMKKYPTDSRFVDVGVKFDEIFRKRVYIQEVDDKQDDGEHSERDDGGGSNDGVGKGGNGGGSNDGGGKGGSDGRSNDIGVKGGNDGGGKVTNDGVEKESIDEGKVGDAEQSLNVVEVPGCEELYCEMDERIIEVFDMHTLFAFHPSHFPFPDPRISSNMSTSSTLPASSTIPSPDCPNFSLGLTQEFEGLVEKSGKDVIVEDSIKKSGVSLSRYMNIKTNIRKNVMVNEYRLSNWLFAMLGDKT